MAGMYRSSHSSMWQIMGLKTLIFPKVRRVKFTLADGVVFKWFERPALEKNLSLEKFISKDNVTRLIPPRRNTDDYFAWLLLIAGDELPHISLKGTLVEQLQGTYPSMATRIARSRGWP